MKRMTHLAALFAATAVLAGCGGGDDPPPPPAATDAVPDTASASTAGLKRYLSDLSAMPVEEKEPVSLDTFVPPTPEDTEPEPVD